MYAKKELCIFEYYKIMMHQQKNYSYIMGGSKQEQKEALGHVWRYVIEEVLHWTPEQAFVYLDSELVKELKLKGTLSILKDEMHESNDYSYALRCAFPDKFTDGFEKQTIDTYNSFASGKDDKKKVKGFFVGALGIERAGVILRYLRNTVLSDMSTEELYDFFHSKKIRLWLKKKRIDVAVSSIYENHPLEFLHENLNAEKDDYYYYSRLIDMEWQKHLEEYRKKQDAQKRKSETANSGVAS